MKSRACALAMLVVCAGAGSLAADDGLDAVAGKALFERNWIPAPASTNAADGLGPLFTARSCTGCHQRGGGARVIDRDGKKDIAGAVVRFGDKDGAADPYYGRQLQTDAVPGLAPEGTASFLPDLALHLSGPPLASGVHAGVRLAPNLFGREIFADIPDGEILRRADPNDRDGDGISGRVNRTATGIGRYGWKAAHATLEEQIADAFSLDIGLSSPLVPHPYGDCTPLQPDCLKMPNGESAAFDGREISSAMLRLVALYLKTVAPESRVELANGGRDLFYSTGCAACHVPELTTRDGRKLKAFTDFLLHDMGPGLDYGVGEPGVASFEWRTAPLIGLAARDGERRYLHDGSAPTIEDAISKHCGEAARARVQFEALGADDRRRLVDYVSSL